MSASLQPLESLFARAIACPPAERDAFLDSACAGDGELRRQIDALLLANLAVGGFLETAVVPGRTDFITAGRQIGRYKLLEKIGEGGVGVVFMAEQQEPVRRKVALKVIKAGMDTAEVIARFESERQALALMEHPNIAHVLDAGATESGRPYFVMELVRGIKITDYCDQNQLSTEERLKLFLPVCGAIQHAHQKGIIHRDIKPSNTLVTLHDGVPVPKVIDFGIAKATQGRLTDKTLFTSFAQFIGTPAYMSPEQAEMSGLDIDTRTDVYSLGVLLYELLTGRTPFDTKELTSLGLDEVRKKIRETEPPRLTARVNTLGDEALTVTARNRRVDPPMLLNEIRGDLEWIMIRCLEKDRARRYETANALAMDLQRHLGHEPVVARPPSAVYVLQKLVRRHRVAFAATAAVACMFFTGATISIWQAVRATRAEHEQGRLRLAEADLRRQAEADGLAARRKAYAADMKLVQQALATDNLGRARKLFDRHRPVAGQQDLRGWEWRYLWQRTRSEAQAVFSQAQSRSVMALSRDGKWLAADGGGLQVWNLETRDVQRVPTSGGSLRIAFSPRESILAFTTGPDQDRRLRLWDPRTRKTLTELKAGRNAFAFTADGESVLTLDSQRLERWRISDGQRLADFPVHIKQAGGSAMVVAASPDGRLAAYRGDDRVYVIDLETGAERWSAKAANEYVIAVGFSPDGRMLATGPGMVESTIRLWEVDSGREMGRLEGHSGHVGAFVFWPDGKTLASASADQTVKIWDVEHGRQLRTLHGHTARLSNLALLPDKRTLVTAGSDGAICLWDTAVRPTNNPCLLPKPIGAWQFSADSQSVVTVDKDGHVERWSGAEFQEKEEVVDIGRFFFPTGRFGDFVYGRNVKFATDRPLVAVGSEDGIVKVWNWERRALAWQFRISDGPVFPIGFLEQGRKLIIAESTESGRRKSGGDGGQLLHEWDLVSGEKVRSWPSGPAPAQMFGVISADERWCASFGFRGGVSLLDRVTGRVTAPKVSVSSTSAQGFSPDGRSVIAASWSGYARLWEIPSFREVATLTDFKRDVHSAIFSPDGRRIATGTDETEAIKLWDVDSLENVLNLEAKGTAFWQTAFSPDGNVLGSANLLGALYLWRAPSWAEIAAAEKAGVSR